MIVPQATAEVFLTAFKALPRQRQEEILGRIAPDQSFRRVLEDVSDYLVIEEERGKPPFSATFPRAPGTVAHQTAGTPNCRTS
jgi:hypothetical protein